MPVCKRCNEKVGLLASLKAHCGLCEARRQKASELANTYEERGATACIDELVDVARNLIRVAPWHSASGDDMEPVVNSLICVGRLDEARELVRREMKIERCERAFLAYDAVERPEVLTEKLLHDFPPDEDFDPFRLFRLARAFVVLAYFEIASDNVLDRKGLVRWSQERAAELGYAPYAEDISNRVKNLWTQYPALLCDACQRFGHLHNAEEMLARALEDAGPLPDHQANCCRCLTLIGMGRLSEAQDILARHELSYHTARVTALLANAYLQKQDTVGAFWTALGIGNEFFSSGILRFAPHLVREASKVASFFALNTLLRDWWV